MSHPHSESGITDEAAIEGHDLIHNAEVEEQKAHGRDALTQPDYGEEAGAGQPSSSSSEQKPKSRKHSTIEKVKEVLHMKK